MFFLLSWSNQNESGWQQKKALRDVCDAHCLCINALQFEYNNKICKYSQTHKNSVLLKYLHWVELKCHLSRYCKMYCKFLFMGVTETGKVSWKSAFCDVTKATVSLFSISFLTFRYRRRFLFFFLQDPVKVLLYFYIFLIYVADDEMYFTSKTALEDWFQLINLKAKQRSRTHQHADCTQDKEYCTCCMSTWSRWGVNKTDTKRCWGSDRSWRPDQGWREGEREGGSQRKRKQRLQKQKAVYGGEQGSCADGLTTWGRFLVGYCTAQEAVVRQERPAKRLWRACFHILLREQCVGDRHLRVEGRCGGHSVSGSLFFFYPLLPSSGIFFSFHASLVYTEGHSRISEANVCMPLALASISITAQCFMSHQ